MEYDSNRTTGKHEKHLINIVGTNYEEYQTPIPYNIIFEVRISTEFISEMDQIVEQILPYFSPYVVNNIKVDELDLD
jgi:hypothetical protein